MTNEEQVYEWANRLHENNDVVEELAFYIDVAWNARPDIKEDDLETLKMHKQE